MGVLKGGYNGWGFWHPPATESPSRILERVTKIRPTRCPKCQRKFQTSDARKFQTSDALQRHLAFYHKEVEV